MDFAEIMRNIASWCNNSQERYTKKEFDFKLNQLRLYRQKIRSYLNSPNPQVRSKAQNAIQKIDRLELDLKKQKYMLEQSKKEMEHWEFRQSIEEMHSDDYEEYDYVANCPNCDTEIGFFEDDTEIECPCCGHLLEIDDGNDKPSESDCSPLEFYMICSQCRETFWFGPNELVHICPECGSSLDCRKISFTCPNCEAVTDYWDEILDDAEAVTFSCYNCGYKEEYELED